MNWYELLIFSNSTEVSIVIKSFKVGQLRQSPLESTEANFFFIGLDNVTDTPPRSITPPSPPLTHPTLYD